MNQDRDPYVDKIINRLKARHETQIKGIVAPSEVGRLCGLIRNMLTGREIDEDEREVLTRYTELNRCFTVAEANRIAAIYGRIKIKKVKRGKELTDVLSKVQTTNRSHRQPRND